MSDPLPSDDDLPAWLVEERGWVQGALFSAPAVSFAKFGIDHSSDEPQLVVGCDPFSANDRFIVASQTCDIRQKLGHEPCIEALRCTVVADANWRGSIVHSARWFEVDRSTGLVAHAMFRVQLDKHALALLTAEPWPDTSERYERFVQWLGRRFDRPAIPDLIVEHFQNKAEDALRAFRKKPLGLAFSSAVRDVRIALPDEDQPPFQIVMVLLLERFELSEDEANALDEVTQLIRARLDPAWVQLGPDRRVTAEEMSLAEYEATRPLFLESLTYRGDELIGAKPPERG